MFEFHISRQARSAYQFDASLFSFNGNVIFANFHAVRLFVQKLNQKRDLLTYPEKAAKAGQVNALGLIDEILHLVFTLYRRQVNPQAMTEALAYLSAHIGQAEVDQLLLQFTQEFPPLVVYRQEQTALDYLEGTTSGVPNREIVLEELALLWIVNKNPAASNYRELFTDQNLSGSAAYQQFSQSLHAYFETQPPFGAQHQNILDMLRAPAIAVPDSLTGQLEFIRTHWSELLGQFLYRLLAGLDLVKEEEKAAFFGPGPTVVPVFGMSAIDQSAAAEQENFSPDREWMPRLVLMAKNTYVWLDQLSKKHQRSITRLDQIPDEDLDALAAGGFSGLWLIGLWERSQASAHIKQLCGNPEAIASAYSLSDYRIADDIGGESAYQNLRDRAWQRGIRLASDMVPNHMGIDSSWVINHPDWFISLDYSPFPSYSYNGPDLSHDGRIGLYLEDHYFSQTDAAVSFKRVDRHTGREKYIYHGNDGTTMPWNDTAQLDYLNPEVREAVIQTILEVARRFPIIRFDAAMTLAKKHFQRLWFPEPGTGGAIPSRADYGLTREQFNAAFPVEFWREVVDRVAQEVPDTLLLAEAFWLMEGYFVRTLGMHRVYNSAFMNMLRNEENSKYRMLIKNTLEFDPEILKRYVNFMNNPDERTAVDQFGKGDKYFGVCILMSTLPGLPMFGHGQVEGLSEKYGMEFRRAYWDEIPDPYLIDRHRRDVFPLLHRRELFAGVDNFLLYDFYTQDGHVNENVFAYSNGTSAERALVVFNNKFDRTRGTIRWSASYVVKSSPDRHLSQKVLIDGLNLHAEDNVFIIFRDQITGMEYIRSSRDLAEHGLTLELDGFKYHVFVGFHEVVDDEFRSYRTLCDTLGGQGVPGIAEAQKALVLAPVQQPFRQIANAGYFKYLADSRLTKPVDRLPSGLLAELNNKLLPFYQGVQTITGRTVDTQAGVKGVGAMLTTLLSIPVLQERLTGPVLNPLDAVNSLQAGLEEDDSRWYALLGWAFIHNLGSITHSSSPDVEPLAWMDEWQLSKILAEALLDLGLSPQSAWKVNMTIRLLIQHQAWFKQSGLKPTDQILQAWISEPEIQSYLGINRYKDTLWFNSEAFEDFAWSMLAAAVLSAAADPKQSASEFVETAVAAGEIHQQLLTASASSGYQILKLIEALKLEA